MVLLCSVTALEAQQNFVKRNPSGVFCELGRRSGSSLQCWNEVGWMDGGCNPCIPSPRPGPDPLRSRLSVVPVCPAVLWNGR